MEIKIDGQTIVLTDVQAQQFKTAILKEVPDVIKPKVHSGFKMYKKPNLSNGAKDSYPMLLTYPCTSLLNLSTHRVKDTSVNYNVVGRDFNSMEMKGFIKALKDFAKQVWPSIKF